MKTYSEKLRDPRWQKKRLDIFDRDGFKCRNCNSNNQELHAHHLLYIKNYEPWDYPDGFIITLCNACHSEWHDVVDMIKQQLTRFNVTNLRYISRILDECRLISARTASHLIINSVNDLKDGYVRQTVEEDRSLDGFINFAEQYGQFLESGVDQ